MLKLDISKSHRWKYTLIHILDFYELKELHCMGLLPSDEDSAYLVLIAKENKTLLYINLYGDVDKDVLEILYSLGWIECSTDEFAIACKKNHYVTKLR